MKTFFAASLVAAASAKDFFGNGAGARDLLDSSDAPAAQLPSAYEEPAAGDHEDKPTFYGSGSSGYGEPAAEPTGYGEPDAEPTGYGEPAADTNGYEEGDEGYLGHDGFGFGSGSGEYPEPVGPVEPVDACATAPACPFETYCINFPTECAYDDVYCFQYQCVKSQAPMPVKVSNRPSHPVVSWNEFNAGVDAGVRTGPPVEGGHHPYGLSIASQPISFLPGQLRLNQYGLNGRTGFNSALYAPAGHNNKLNGGVGLSFNGGVRTGLPFGVNQINQHGPPRAGLPATGFPGYSLPVRIGFPAGDIPAAPVRTGFPAGAYGFPAGAYGFPAPAPVRTGFNSAARTLPAPVRPAKVQHAPAPAQTVYEDYEDEEDNSLMSSLLLYLLLK